MVRMMCPGGLSIVALFYPEPLPSSLPSVPGAPFIVGLSNSGRIQAKQLREPEPRSAVVRDVENLKAGFVCVRASVEFPTIPVPTFDRGQEEELCAEALQGLVWSAVVVLRDRDGKEVVVLERTDKRPLAAVMGWETEDLSKGKCAWEEKDAVEADILLPVGRAVEERREKGVGLTVGGGMHVEAVVMQDATLGTVLTAVRDDMDRSLRARVHWAEEGKRYTIGDTAPRTVIRDMSVRVVARKSGKGNVLPMTDYMQEGESWDADVMTRFVEVLSWNDDEIDANQVQQVEQFRSDDASQRQRNLAKPSALELSQSQDANASASSSMTLAQGAIIAAFVMAILAIIIKELL